ADLQGRAASWDFTAASPDGSVAPTLTLTVTDPGDRDSIYRAMTEPSARAQLIVRRSFDVASLVPPQPGQPQAQDLFRDRQTAIDSTIPFTFDPALDKNIFASLGGVGSEQTAWTVQQVPYAKANRSFPYYQDAGQPTHIYYLPDEFKISRQPASPHAPSIVVSTNGNDPSDLTFTMVFVAVPVWTADRIAAARTWWQKFLNASAPPSLYLFEASDTALALTLPAADGVSAPSLTPQPGAVIDIATGIKCAVTLSLAQFQQVYAGLFDDVSQLLSGVVTVTVDSDVEHIPFTARAADFAGAIVDSTTTFVPGIDQFRVVLTDSIESPIQFDSLSGQVMKGPVDPATGQQSTKVPQLLQLVDPKPPTKLVPQGAVTPGSAGSSSSSSSSSTGGLLGGLLSALGGSVGGGQVEGAISAGKAAPNTVALTIQVMPGQGNDPTCAVVLDLDQVRVVPDSNAIWESIMSNQVVGPVQRSIKVNAFASMFAPVSSTGSSSSASSGADVKAIHVVFDSGQTLDFDSSTPADASGLMTQTISLSVPVKAYVLGTGDTSYYKYRVDLITPTGTQQGTWVSSNTDSFYVQSSD
ncbi:MAG TPA: hypothetical protein VEV38_09465, partial [Candidatus Eremiobacteraceae bacterium]|nr:hypothetical protein [Candidatus Eremiobacteraceae bacterium]